MIAAPQRRGTCPSLSAPMPTGDGLLVRLNPADGSIAPRQLAELARAAGRFGNGLMEITARGSLQIRGLTEATAPQLAVFVDGLGIDVRAGVPVDTAPLAGLDPKETADPRPLAAAIRDGIAQRGLSPRLGPKVSVVVDGGGRSMLDGVKADVRLTAARTDDAVAWRLALAGDAAGATFVQTFAEADACTAALDHLDAIAALGRKGRARDLLVYTEMPSSFAPPSGLPAISPSRGEITPIAGLAAVSWSVPDNCGSDDAGATKTLPISPLEGEMAGRPEGGVPKREVNALPFGTAIPLSDSRFALRVALPFGAIDAATLEHFAGTLAALGVIELRLCPERSLLVLSEMAAQASAAVAAARAAGLVVDGADPRLAIVACAGLPACASARYATRRLAEAIVREAPELLAPGARLHLSGCDKRCAEPSGASIAVIGREGGCVIVANGTPVPPALRGYLVRRGEMGAQDRRAS